MFMSLKSSYQFMNCILIFGCTNPKSKSSRNYYFFCTEVNRASDLLSSVLPKPTIIFL